ncbi:MAG TPA: sensor histidine kinase [Anaerolineales bacterium]|nr:sensor histidine kinase [Anaerolineales bacterium]
MGTLNRNPGDTIAFPFYIFISLLLGSMGVVAFREVWLSGESALALLAFVLVFSHIGLHWINFLPGNRGSRWWIFYYSAQTILMISIVLLLNGHSDIGISFIFSATICMVGEALGVWGNSRRSLLLGTFYVGMLISLLFVFSERERFYAALSELVVNGGAIILFMVLLNQQLAEREKAQELAERLESANAQLAANTARIESLTLQNERQRMARELHDTLAQGVAGLVLQLEAVKAHLASKRLDRASSIVEQALARARGTLSESRAAIDDLRSEPGNLAEAIREKVDRFRQGTGIPCDLELSIEENQLQPGIADHGLSILSEALANVMKHAQATKVNVRFSVHEDELEVEVHDDGKGFDNHHVSGDGHYGLLGMRERARLIGGELKIESNAGRGTTVRFIVPRSQGGGGQ